MSQLRDIRFARALDYAERCMTPFRKAYLEMTRQYASNYGGEPVDVPLNTVYETAQALIPPLTLDPRPTITARFEDQGPMATKLQAATIAVCDHIQLGRSFRQGVLRALLSACTFYVGRTSGKPGPYYDRQSYDHDVGVPFVDVISLDRLVLDPFSTDWPRMEFIGHTSDYALEYLAEDQELFRDKGRVEKLRQFQADPNNGRTVEGLSRSGSNSPDDRWHDVVQIRQVWVPKDKAIVFLPADCGAAETIGELARVDCDDDDGPYVEMVLAEVPDNAMPLPHLRAIMQLHHTINVLARKQRDMAESQKDLVLFPLGTADADAGAIRTAISGSLVGVGSDPKQFQEVSFGGSSRETSRDLQSFRGELNRIAGNPDSIGGMSAQSGTLGQDQLLYANASAKINYWRNIIRAAAKRVCDKIARYVYDDPNTFNVQIEIPGMEPVTTQYRPGERTGSYDDFKLEIGSYGLTSDSPEQQYARGVEFLRAISSLIPAAQAQGIAPDAQAITTTLGKLGNIPGVEQFWTQAVPPMQPGMEPGGVGGMGGSPVTNNTRVSINGPARPQRQRREITERQPQEVA